MNKKLISVTAFVSLFCSARFALALSIQNPLNVSTFSALFLKIANVVGGLIAGLSTIMLIISAIFYLTSAGNPQRIESGKKTLIYAIAGMAIGLSAVAIVNFVCTVTGASC